MIGVVAALLLSACGGGSTDGDDGRVRVIAGFAPLAEIAERIGNDSVDVENLTPAGAEAHDLELTTDQVDAIEDADLVLYLGGGFQPAVEAAAARSDATALDLLEGEEGDDPHVWLDPVAMGRLAAKVRASLPDDAVDAEAADAYLAELEALDDEFREGLADCDRRVIVTAHDAFGRMAERYDLDDMALTGISPEAEPDPKRLADLADLIQRTGVTTVFTEVLVSPEIAETLAREAGARTAVLDPIESFASENDDYGTVMRRNLAVLREALGCR
jgi:zinc transport system substrate-binding protein